MALRPQVIDASFAMEVEWILGLPRRGCGCGISATLPIWRVGVWGSYFGAVSVGSFGFDGFFGLGLLITDPRCAERGVRVSVHGLRWGEKPGDSWAVGAYRHVVG